MQDSKAIREDLIATFKGLTADGKSIEQSPHFEDYVNIGVCLSQGPRAPANKTALLALEEAMIKRIKKSVDQAKGAQAYFQAIEEHHKNQGPTVPKDKDYSKLLSGSLDEFERQHGFVVVGERLPNYVGFIGGTVFAEALSQGYHWKDVGAEDVHGEYTHRLQWYLVISAGVIKTVTPSQEVKVYKSIAEWQIARKNKYLWIRLFDLNASDKSTINGDKEDFRCPENLNTWLTGTEAPEFCPVLRSFLRARMAKRAATFSALNPEGYLQKKLGWSEEDIFWYKNWVQTEERQKKRPSLRIIFPQGEKPVLSPYVNEKKRF